MEELKGKLYSLMIDPPTRKYILSFLVESGDVESFYKKTKKETPLQVKLNPMRRKRSLDANAYAWVLMSKIAALSGLDKDSVYEIMLQRYGCFWQDGEGNYFSFLLPAGEEPKQAGIHAKCISSGWRDGIRMNTYLLLKGSSEYDSLEMSRFIDGIILDCKDLGIETMPPEELNRMMAAWNP